MCINHSPSFLGFFFVFVFFLFSGSRQSAAGAQVGGGAGPVSQWTAGLPHVPGAAYHVPPPPGKCVRMCAVHDACMPCTHVCVNR